MSNAIAAFGGGGIIVVKIIKFGVQKSGKLVPRYFRKFMLPVHLNQVIKVVDTRRTVNLKLTQTCYAKPT